MKKIVDNVAKMFRQTLWTASPQSCNFYFVALLVCIFVLTVFNKVSIVKL